MSDKETGNDMTENDYVYCEGCKEEYWLPEDTEKCPFCGEELEAETHARPGK